jgi:hypothetical protein
VFSTLPKDSINTNIHETFVAAAPAPVVPKNKEEWARQRDGWLAALKEKSFAGWPEEKMPLKTERKFSITRDGIKFEAFDFDSEQHVRLRLYVLTSAAAKQVQETVLSVTDETGWQDERGLLRVAFAEEMSEEMPPDTTEERKALGFKVRFETLREALKGSTSALAFLAPRGVGLSAWSGDARRQVQIRRRFMLLGVTLDSARVWDIRRACQTLRLVPQLAGAKLNLNAGGAMAVNVVYASLFEPGIDGLQLSSPAQSHRLGPDYLNVLRVLDVPQAMTMAAERGKVLVFSDENTGWEFPTSVSGILDWSRERFIVHISSVPTSLPLPRSQ